MSKGTTILADPMRCVAWLLAALCLLAPLVARGQARVEESGVASTSLPLYAPSPAVLNVGNHGPEGEVRANGAVYAQRNDEIWLDICNFEGWIDELKQQKKLPDNHEPKHLILYLDHIPLIGVPSIYNYAWSDRKLIGDQWMEMRMTTVCFRLVRTSRSKEAWSHFLNQPVLTRQAVVSAGFDNGEEIRSYLRVDGKVKDGQFFLRIIPPTKTALGTAIILGALLAFLWLARHTHIIRDTSAPRRPDGVRPYSLARSQMAFWFFLVVSSYFFLWIITGDMDTLNASVLGLIGISAATALGSAFIDAGKPQSVEASGNIPIVDVTKSHLEVVEELMLLRAETQKHLEALQKARTRIPSADTQKLSANEVEQDKVREKLANYRWQTVYFAWPSWKGVMYDLLAENNLISFHRFQIFVWTLVLGVMFVANVYSELAMPEFSATLLGLLGISAGTYVGFKLPEPKTG